SIFGGSAWEWDGERMQYYLHNFLTEQPDLNFHNPAVRAAILDVARFWLERGVDGFRLDVANYYFHDAELRSNPPSGRTGPRPRDYQEHVYDRSRPETIDFLKALRALANEYGDRALIAEIDSDRPIERSLDYTSGDDRLHTAYNFFFLKKRDLTAAHIHEAFAPWTESGEVDAWPAWAFSNHDAPRAASRLLSAGADQTNDEAAAVLNALLICLYGTIFLYQGEELGLPQAEIAFEDLVDPEAIRFWPHTLGRDGCRTPMPWAGEAPNAGFSSAKPWLPVDPRHLARAADRQSHAPASTLNRTREALRARRALQALRSGRITFLTGPTGTVAFARHSADERCICAFNLTQTSQRLALTESDAISKLREAVLLRSADARDGAIQLGPYGYGVWRAERQAD
ncbi:MAG: alpha-amylase family glycosyl hydrolase, partial [Pseudomonadota bacterium]